VAQHNLGLMYDQGIGLAQDASLAVEWFQKAAEQEFAEAQHCLGAAYRYGTGVVQNVSLTVHWYQKAAEQEHAAA
jgi:TPR repeat protein